MIVFPAAIYYVANAFKQTAILLFGVMPYLLAALLIQYLSQELRRRLTATLGVRAFVMFTAPGVVLHELSHAAACLVFGHRIVEMRLFDPGSDGTLGYVRHMYNSGNVWQRAGNFFIGVIPVYGGTLVLWLLPVLLFPDGFRGSDLLFLLVSPMFWQRWQSWLYIYASVCVASHINLSRSDLSGALDGALVMVVLVLLFELLTAWHFGIQIAIRAKLSDVFFSVLPSLAITAFLMSVLILLLPNNENC